MKRKIYVLIFCAFNSLWVTAQANSTKITLNQCIDIALQNNPYVKEVANDGIIAGLALKSARSDLYPVLSTQISGGYSNQYRLNNDYRTGNGTFSADQLLWQNGKVNATIKQTRYNLKAAGYTLQARKKDIILSVKTYYFNCLLQNQLYEIAIENVSKANMFLEYAHERYKIGSGRRSDVLKAESDLAESEFERDTYFNSLTQAQNELSMLTSLSTDRLSNLESTWQDDRPDSYGHRLDSLYNLALCNYPELQNVNNLKLLQQSKIREANAELYPRLGFNGGYNWSYNPALSRQKGWYTLLTLQWQIFNGNKQHNQIQIEKTRKTIYEIREEQVKTFLIKEISNRLINIKTAESQIKLTSRLLKTTLENLEIAKAQYKVGTGSMLELTDARVNDLLAKQKNIQAIAAFQIAWANLERLTGIFNK
jgi:outer membrane protein